MASAGVTHRRETRRTALTEITLQYLLSGDARYLDRLLGRFIAGRQDPEEVRPEDLLFRTLSRVCITGTTEQLRRLTEAAPALCELDEDRTIELLERLREHWDPDRWRGDIRRRAVEALAIPNPRSGSGLIDRTPIDRLQEMLRLREDDEIFTALAIAEAAGRLDDRDRVRAEHVRAGLTRAENHFSDDEREGLKALIELADAAGTDDYKEMERFALVHESSANLFQRLAVARTLWSLGTRRAAAALAIAERLSVDPERYVRRPLARERNVRFLIGLLANGNYRDRARTLLLKLLSDEDSIIRRTTFDMADSLSDQPDVYREFCVRAASDPNPDLRRRGQDALEDLDR